MNEQCGKVGHIARNCTADGQGGGYGGGYGGGGYGGGGRGFGGGQKTCYSCGGFGHMSREHSFPLPGGINEDELTPGPPHR